MLRSLRALSLVFLLALTASAHPASASSPGVRVDDLDGIPRITLEGSWAGSRYTILRADGPSFQPVSEANSLCTGDCFVLDRGVLRGGTYEYRFDLQMPDGSFRQYGPYSVTIGPAAIGLSARVYPSVIRDRGTLRVVAAIPAGARQNDLSQATQLDAEITLHDLRGARLRTLYRGKLDRLTFDLPFRATDDDNSPLPPALYFLRFRAGEQVSHSRITVIR